MADSVRLHHHHLNCSPTPQLVQGTGVFMLNKDNEAVGSFFFLFGRSRREDVRGHLDSNHTSTPAQILIGACPSSSRFCGPIGHCQVILHFEALKPQNAKSPGSGTQASHAPTGMADSGRLHHQPRCRSELASAVQFRGPLSPRLIWYDYELQLHVIVNQ